MGFFFFFPALYLGTCVRTSEKAAQRALNPAPMTAKTEERRTGSPVRAQNPSGLYLGRHDPSGTAAPRHARTAPVSFAALKKRFHPHHRLSPAPPGPPPALTDGARAEAAAGSTRLTRARARARPWGRTHLARI